MGRNALLGLVDSLESAIRGLRSKGEKKGWSEYYSTCTYNEQNFKEKKEFIKNAIAAANPTTIWDIGCNTGSFSFIAAEMGIHTLAVDFDHGSIDRLYQECRSREEKNILPLVIDITNPSAGAGWACEERSSFLDRGKADLVLALALVHHLAIANNLPFERLAAFFAGISPKLVIEFVPKDDPQTRRLLGSRQDIFTDYDQVHFESQFSRYFKIEQKRELSESKRTMYLMKRIA
jgi:ribosomal protein L11 methylase PrmA